MVVLRECLVLTNQAFIYLFDCQKKQNSFEVPQIYSIEESIHFSLSISCALPFLSPLQPVLYGAQIQNMDKTTRNMIVVSHKNSIDCLSFFSSISIITHNQSTANHMQAQLNLSQLLDKLIPNNYFYLFLQFNMSKSFSPNIHKLKDANPELNKYQCHELIKLGSHRNPQRNNQQVELWLLAITGSEDSLVSKIKELGSQEVYEIKYISKQIKIPLDHSLKEVKLFWSQLNMIEAHSNELGHQATCCTYEICELPYSKESAVAVFNDPDDSIVAFATLFQRSFQIYKKIKFVECNLQYSEEEQHTLYIDIRKEQTVKPKISENKEIHWIQKIETSKSIFEEYQYHEDRRLIDKFIKKKLDGYQIYFVTTRIELAPTEKQKPMILNALAEIQSENNMTLEMETENNSIILSFQSKRQAKCLFERLLKCQVHVRITFA